MKTRHITLSNVALRRSCARPQYALALVQHRNSSLKARRSHGRVQGVERLTLSSKRLDKTKWGLMTVEQTKLWVEQKVIDAAVAPGTPSSLDVETLSCLLYTPFPSQTAIPQYAAEICDKVQILCPHASSLRFTIAVQYHPNLLSLGKLTSFSIQDELFTSPDVRRRYLQYETKSIISTNTVFRITTQELDASANTSSLSGSPDFSSSSPNAVLLHSMTYQLHRMLHDITMKESKKYEFEQSLPAHVHEMSKLAFERMDNDPIYNRLTKISFRVNVESDASQDFFYEQIRPEDEHEEHRVVGSIQEEVPQTAQCTYIALGSNVGDRVANIEEACRKLAHAGIKVLRTSALYETKAMYVEDQESFINGVCEVYTGHLNSQQLLDRLKSLEVKLGRQKTLDKGPRSIDLDILLHQQCVVDLEHLSIPHRSMLEREFVLRPLCDLIPHESLPTGQKAGTFLEHLASLSQQLTPMSSVTPIRISSPPIRPLLSARRTHLMAIMNLTPDSFSDGGVHSSSPTSLLSTIRHFVTTGATIFDIGGQSSRPHATSITADEEIARILPTIQFIRSLPEFNHLAISVDTYRASVAAAAITAGADIINDISAGTLDKDMLSTAAKLGCTIILMHMRGTPNTMTKLTSYPDGLITTIASELRDRVRAAEQAGIFRWRMILDPGIGFAKNEAQNLEILRRLGELRKAKGLEGMPWVVGSSRKGFIGRITNIKEPKERTWGTAATVAAAVHGGADVVRVHDVGEMAQVVRMSDAIWRV